MEQIWQNNQNKISGPMSSGQTVSFIKKPFLWLQKHKKFSVSLVLIAVVSALFLLYVKTRIPPQPIPQAEPVKLVSVDPQGTIESLWSIEPVTFVFNKSVDPETIRYTVSPLVKTRVVFENKPPNTFSVIPLDGWAVGQTYTIRVFKGLKSSKDGILENDVVVSITRTEPPPEKIIHLEERGY